MKEKIILFLYCFFFLFYGKAQDFLTPLVSNVKDNILFNREDNSVVSNGFFPISYKDAQLTVTPKDTTRSWVYRKLFMEHFIQQSGDNFFLAIDPLFNLSLGKNIFSSENTTYFFQNTRGAQAFGEVGGVLSFYTAFYENQARFPEFQEKYFRSRGELFPHKGIYHRRNAVIPNGGRTKNFKKGGFDYSSAIAYVRLTPLPYLAVQFGNAPRFYGWGYRSMLLSDNSNTYTHLTIDWEIMDGLSYTLMRGKQLNLIRKKATKMVEAPYERKGIGLQYLSYRPIPSLVIGLFESTIYLRDIEEGTQRVDPYFYNPVIGVNTLINGAETKDLKNLIGLNLAWQIHPHHLVYAQLVSDDFSSTQYGFQFGYRGGNLFHISNLFLQAEINFASSRLYAANNPRMAYTHFNLPLAHPLGNNFRELVFRASYQWKGLYVMGKCIYYHAQQPLTEKSMLFESKNATALSNPIKVLNTRLEIGYELNPATHLRVYIAGNYREGSKEIGTIKNYAIFSIGLRSALRNHYFDF